MLGKDSKIEFLILFPFYDSHPGSSCGARRLGMRVVHCINSLLAWCERIRARRVQCENIIEMNVFLCARPLIKGAGGGHPVDLKIFQIKVSATTHMALPLAKSLSAQEAPPLRRLQAEMSMPQCCVNLVDANEFSAF